MLARSIHRQNWCWFWWRISGTGTLASLAIQPMARFRTSLWLDRYGEAGFALSRVHRWDPVYFRAPFFNFDLRLLMILRSSLASVIGCGVGCCAFDNADCFNKQQTGPLATVTSCNAKTRFVLVIWFWSLIHRQDMVTAARSFSPSMLEFSMLCCFVLTASPCWFWSLGCTLR
jgi:hypothetical protein